MNQILENHKSVWEKKKILRIVYTEWYRMIRSNLKNDNGITVELGGGSGNFKEFMPECISSDIDFCSWLDLCFDAHQLPFKTGTISNFVLIDVLHHFSNPVLFFKETLRTLERNGRIVIIEPFPSPFSLVVYKMFHPEPFKFRIDYFNINETSKKNPWDSNQAIAYLLFFKHLKSFLKELDNGIRIIKKRKISFILYPASGGFENRSLIPDFLIPIFQVIEILLIPLRSLLAFRCFIVIEKEDRE